MWEYLGKIGPPGFVQLSRKQDCVAGAWCAGMDPQNKTQRNSWTIITWASENGPKKGG